MDKNKIETIKKLLRDYYEPNVEYERVGFIRPNNYIVEVPNISDLPRESFNVSAEVIEKEVEENKAIGTWHTHPKGLANLSYLDYYSYKSYPELYHFIVGSDKTKCYKWDTDKDALIQL